MASLTLQRRAKNRSLNKLGTLMLTASLLLACSKSPDKKPTLKTYTVHQEAMHNVLYFTGTVQPLREQTLVSPMEAVVEKMGFHYGQYVKSGQEVFTLYSTELQKQYNETLTDYLKAKDAYSSARTKFRGTEDLWQAGLVSKNNYLSEQSSLITLRVSLMQATHKLNDMLKKMGNGSAHDLSKLSFSNFTKVRQALSGKHDVIHLESPIDGVLLYPPKANDDKSERINIGSSIKAAQVLALVGDMSGIRVEIAIPEVDIDKIKPGMRAVVHGVAFGRRELKGRLISINAQASGNTGSTLPSFSAVVEVRDLDAHQHAWLKVGMSASIELAMNSTNKLSVPLTAVYQQQGKSMVRLRNTSGETITKPVITGPALGNRVVIDSGLAVGDVVLYE